MIEYFDWHFPLPRPHTGIALGNGVQGVLVWGDDVLCLTVARAGFWDRRGGQPFGSRVTFARVRELLETGDAAGIQQTFAAPRDANLPARPFQIGGARLELQFDGGFRPVFGRLHFESATLEITLGNSDGATRKITIRQLMDSEICVLEGADDAQIRVRPTWEWVGEKLEAWGYEPPRILEIENGGAFVQSVPDGDSLAFGWAKRGANLPQANLLLATALCANSQDAENALKSRLNEEISFDATREFWANYWRDVPKIEIADADLQDFWALALWKQAGLTTPSGVAATLQGAWMESYQLPPWSNDYHFNINVQLIYYPALMTNRLEHFAPLWEMIKRWMPKLRAAGEAFFEREGALMLPHAVDDECQVVGTFWTGTIDHACTAWVAQMAWLHFRYGGDESVLSEVAWPLLNGAFEGYWAMKEDQNGRICLPVSVSPEYRGSQMNAWGRDASFQLAAWHSVSQMLTQAAEILGEPLDARWREVEANLPPYTLENGRIALWDGLELEESHRHHSHLAGIWPFGSFEPLDDAHFEVVRKSVHFWNEKGAGNWTGWCLPWASILCSRLNLPDAALAWLKWLDHYSNVGFGTRHNADFAGIAVFDNAELERRASGAPENEVMQMDATMGFLIAVCELLVQNRRDANGKTAIHVLPALPRRWRELEFDGIRCESAFLVGATVEKSRVVEVRVTSEQGGDLRICLPWGEKIERITKRGEIIVLRPE